MDDSEILTLMEERRKNKPYATVYKEIKRGTKAKKRYLMHECAKLGYNRIHDSFNLHKKKLNIWHGKENKLRCAGRQSRK